MSRKKIVTDPFGKAERHLRSKPLLTNSPTLRDTCPCFQSLIYVGVTRPWIL